MKIIIDGYNLLNISPEFSTRPEELLEGARNRLIDKLSLYKRQKNASITLVFDGWKSGGLNQSRDVYKGIKIIYSKLGEKADQVIMQMIADSSRDIVVVTSDREIRDFAEKYNTTSVSSSEFYNKIEMASYIEMKGAFEEDEEDYDPTSSVKKKGNPKRRSKAERKRKAKLRKL